MCNIITADREKEESMCSQDSPLQPDALNASILSVYLKSILYIYQKIFQIHEIFLICLCRKDIGIYFKVVPTHTMICGTWESMVNDGKKELHFEAVFGYENIDKNATWC